ncbi:MAG: CRTAC1 family protein [bacterium]|nr:CRTAC1 family protein [bacterium]
MVTTRRRGLESTLAAAGLVLVLCTSCGDADPSLGEAAEGPAAAAAIFVDEAASSGLDFVHFNGMIGQFYYSEMMGSGVGLIDYDNDGDLDVYLVQGGVLNPDKGLDETVFPPTPEMLPLQDRLYRNDLTVDAAGRRRLAFTDVTAQSGIRATGYGMGVAAGDFDNDGWVDLFITNAGPNQLWRNRGDGTFEDRSAAVAVEDDRWSVSTAVLDFDRDGWLDLYTANYVIFTVAAHKLCRTLAGAPDYCGPLAFKPQRDRLLRNRGDGTFEDLSAALGVADGLGAGMGAVTADFNTDGLLDIYVANDGMPNFMWMQQADGTFRNDALVTGCALNTEGRAEAGMGVIAGDYDGDGDEDLFVNHLILESSTLYRNDGHGFFEDVSVASGLGTASWQYTCFGNAWIDYDNDGRLDVISVCGAVLVIEELAARDDPYPIHMPNQLFHNLGDGRFEEVTDRAGAVFELSEVSRGLAVGDLDNDGDSDVVVANNSGPVRLLVNQVGQDRHWLGLRLLGAKLDRDLVGALVGVERPQGPTLWRRVRIDGSYLSSGDPRLLFGLGSSPAVAGVVVHWPSGRVERVEVEPDRYTTLHEGS